MSAQEDNATLEVLTRAAAAGRLDPSRVALLRTASDFGAPYPGQTDADGLLGSLDAGGLQPSLDNLPKAAAPLVTAITSDWSHWQAGVPP
jgi:purine nucleoside permease